MKLRWLRRLPFVLVLFLTPIGAWSQESGAEGASAAAAPAAAAPAADEAEVLVDHIRATDSQLVELIGQLEGAEGEGLDRLRSQIGDLAREQRDNLTALVALAAARREAGGDLALIEQQGEQLLRRSSRRLRSYIELFQAALEREKEKRAGLEVGELQVFEHRLAEESARLDRFYQGLQQLTDQMASFGLSTDDEEAFLERELEKRGEQLLQTLELTGRRLDEVRLLLEKSPDDAELQAQAFAVEERREAAKASLLATVHMMKQRGMDYLDLEVRTVELTGEITPDALELDVAVGVAGRTLGRLTTYLRDNGPQLLLRLAVIVAILALFWLLARLARRFIGRILDRTQVSTSKLLKDMVVSLAGRLVLLVGLIIALGQLGINLGPLLAGLGIAGFIVGFALQETLANFASGAMILAYRPFDVGDSVEAAGVTGKVKDMNLVSTRILTFDNQTLVVPNSKIWGDIIRNVTAEPQRRVDMVFGISYEDDIPKAERVLGEIVAAHDKALDDPAPVIKLHTLNDSSVDFIVRPWAKSEDYWDVYWDITREVKLRFDREGISIPFPQRDVHLITASGDE